MKLIVIGITHKEVPVEIRENFFLSPEERRRFLRYIRTDDGILETIILSTCNRTEIYANVLRDLQGARESILDALYTVKGLERQDVLDMHFFQLAGYDGIRHFMEVATGLDSLVIGEKQILGQVKAAVEMSREEGLLARDFNLLTQTVIRAGKKAQVETSISCGGASVSWAAVQMAERALGELGHRSILIIGAGKMSELTASQLQRKGAGDTYVVNRTREKAETLAARIGGRAYSYLDLYKIMGRVDLCIVSASAGSYLLSRDYMAPVMRQRRNRELICIDISTPRNIEPAVGDLPGVKLFKIDDLSAIVRENLSKRRSAVAAVNKLIDCKMHELKRKLRNETGYDERVLPYFVFSYSI
ncbi:MAG: glutamyl-tRNA reductase [Candidatus Omnitrophica bacterium]|nr:glutamyl-tRNA reductase [Candidatus Omnitrophota bacterium]MCB9720917.1 glutamyl-tRNA reductase [Candidatus Omnitrophota bacterium]